MAVGERRDPYRSYNFLVEIDGITRAGFRECSGLDSTQDPIDYREGTDPLTPRKLPGLVKYSNISLKRGITDDAELWEWRQKAMDGKVDRKNGSIVLLNDTGDEVVRWNFREGWPTKWTGPTFNATGTEVAIETLDIVHEGVTKA
ncbi:MAG: phage tail protein [Anaerolineales bacterium]|nr:phage tail protein [Anaerolineales bacterium]